METNWWLEVENSYVARVKERQDLFKKYGSMVLDYLPGSELACKELMEMCLQFYCARYPMHFSLSADKKIFRNGLLNTSTEIKRFHPLHILLNNVPEDFAIVLRNDEDGMYYFRAGVICSSLGWNVGTKIGMQLEEIHKPIPDHPAWKLGFRGWHTTVHATRRSSREAQRGTTTRLEDRGLLLESRLADPATATLERRRGVQLQGSLHAGAGVQR